MNMDLKSKHIVISQQNYDKLKAMGAKGDSFDDVIEKLLRTLKYGF